MCSKRWANPVRPACSFFEPTWNHWLTLTIGSLRSTWRMTSSPFGRVYFSNSIFGASAGGAGAEAGTLRAAAGLRAGGGEVCAAWAADEAAAAAVAAAARRMARERERKD